MLVLKRKEGQWVEITHRSGDLIRIRVCKIEAGQPGHLNLAFEDDARHFEIERPERFRKVAAVTVQDNRAPEPQTTHGGVRDWENWAAKGEERPNEAAPGIMAKFLQGISPDRIKSKVN